MKQQNPPNNDNPSDAPDRRGPMDRVNRAIRNPYNILVLALIVAVGAIALSVWPIVAAVVLEAVYLGVAAMRRQVAAPPAASPITPSMPSAKPVYAASGRKLGASRGASAALGGMTPARGRSTGARPGLVEADREINRDGNEQYLRLEATYRLIELQASGPSPVLSELLTQLAHLLERFTCFSTTRDHFEELLKGLAHEARGLPGAAAVSRVPDLQLVYADGDLSDASFEARVQCWIKQAHDGFERELREIAWNRRELRDPQADAEMEQRAQVLLRRNRYTDKIGKTLLNLHFAIRLIERRFDAINLELSTRSPEQVLSDVNALVLQTQALSRSVDDLLPPEESVEYHAA